jgi:4-hydroxy-tetrahydrodipicolinate synthase
MPAQVRISGIVSVLPTAFDANEAVVHEDIAREVEAAVAFGIGAVCLPAYASEFYKLSEDERAGVVRTAAEAAAGRIPVIGQSNHPSAREAVTIARRNVAAGADVISFAIPRVFATPEADLLAYCRSICSSVDVPVLIQDFNPGGATVGASFCRSLNEACPNFLYIKLEEPMLGPRLRAIREATEDRVAVLEGWGGMYMPELFGYGLAGAMPGLGHADVLRRVWDLGSGGDVEAALDVFDRVIAQIVFSLENMEFYLTMEKRLLAARGIIRNTGVRGLTYTADPEALAYADRLNDRVLRLLDDLGLPRCPLG